jgi:pimeloyl-ACP methyl ester carboxylesterase
MTAARTTTVTTSDGRTLEVRDTGTKDGAVLVFHSGTPSAAVAAPYVEAPAIERGFRVISYSRPGYGGSSPRPDGAESATIADDVADTASILDHLGVREFVTIGWSGGGPRALGCAALLGDRCLAAACVAGIGPATEIEWDVREGMAEENVAEFTAVLDGPDALDAYLSAQSDTFSVTGEQLADALGGLAPEADRAVLTGEMAESLAAGFRSAGQQGAVGWRDDDLTLVRPWRFDLAAIEVPVSIWAGDADTMVPFRHGKWLAERVSGARAHLLEGEGHISLMVRADRILDDLMDLAGLGAGG